MNSDLWSITAASFLAAFALVCLWIILDSRIDDGVVLKLCLMLTFYGACHLVIVLLGAFSAASWENLLQALSLMLIGMLSALAAVWFKRLKQKHPLRRLSDWKVQNYDARLSK